MRMMEDDIINTTMAANVTLTEAQIVTTAVIGSLLLTIVVLNIVMYAIYKNLSDDSKLTSTVKIGKQESVQLYQMKTTGEYNTLSNSSMNQSNCRSVKTTSFSGDDTASVECSSGDITQSYNIYKSFNDFDNSPLPGKQAYDTFSNENISPQFETNLPDIQVAEQFSSEKPEQESIASVETAAQVHDSGAKISKKTQQLSHIHMYQHNKSQMINQKIHRDQELNNQSNVKPVLGIVREAPIELKEKSYPRKKGSIENNQKCRQSQVGRIKTIQDDPRISPKVKGYVDMTDFDNDTEASVLAALDSVQTYPGAAQLLTSSRIHGCPVVEFQNKAFEFSETKTSLEEVDDTDL